MSKYLKIKTPIGNFTVSDGNSKVQFPIVNVGSGMDCSSRAWCPFDGAIHKESGRKRCYAQKTEALYPSVLASRRLNEKIISTLNGVILGKQVADALIAKLTANRGQWNFDTVRINESGDLNKMNIKFVETLTTELRLNGIAVYLYSKAPKSLRDRAINAGANVLHSERDFVAYGSQDELEKSGSFPCQGICGPCKACPTFNGKQSIGILEH